MAIGIRTLSDPAAHLFSDRVSEALDLELPTMQPGYGLIGTVVVAVLLLVVVGGFAVVTSVWPGRSVDPAEVSRTDESS